MTSSASACTTLRAADFGADEVRTDAGHVRSFEETWARIRPLLSLVPVTRVYDATPLDVLGVPVWSAVTPLARDLTVHGGKGATALASKLSAVMEAVARVCAESIGDERVHRASYAELAREQPGITVAPARLGLPFDTGYRPEAPIRWTGAYDLVADECRWVPVDFVISPGTDGVAPGTETNGLAAGNSYTEATLHALYEVVERDAVAKEEFFHQHHDPAWRLRRPVRLIHPDTLPDDCAPLLAGLRRVGVRLAVQDLTPDSSIPVYAVVLIDESYPGAEGVPVTFAGYGCDLHPQRAVMRALTEAAQAHTGVTLGARDDFEGLRPVPDRPAMLRRRLDLLYAEPTERFTAGEPRRGDLLADLRTVLDRLHAVGHDSCLVSELTRPDLGIPVVRVLVPGLAAPYPDSARRPVPELLETVL